MKRERSHRHISSPSSFPPSLARFECGGLGNDESFQQIRNRSVMLPLGRVPRFYTAGTPRRWLRPTEPLPFVENADYKPVEPGFSCRSQSSALREKTWEEKGSEWETRREGASTCRLSEEDREEKERNGSWLLMRISRACDDLHRSLTRRRPTLSN